MYQTHRRWWTVADASRLLRVSTDALYDACQKDFPHKRVGNIIKIPCEALRMEWVPDEATRRYLSRSDSPTNCGWATDPEQLTLPLGPIVPIRVWRNTGTPIVVDPYGYPTSM